MILPKGVSILNFTPHTDSRGNLSVAEAERNVPFGIERVFWIYDVPAGEHRASHSHNQTYELLVAVSGSFKIDADDGVTKVTLAVDSPSKGVVVPPNVWCDLYDFEPGTVCMVMASHHYSKEGYTNTYNEFLDSQIAVRPYDAGAKEQWNSFVKDSKNGTFLFDRDYMDYHSDRFKDCSLMFYYKDSLVAVLPANYNDKENRIESHGGLTYGGLVMSRNLHATKVLDIMQTAVQYFKCNYQADRLLYKPVPYIYSSLPSQEDMYALFRLNSKPVASGLSTVIDLSNILPMQTLRKRCIAKARKNGVSIEQGNSGNDLEQYWSVLSETLKLAHGVNPVHTVDEMRMLMERFPSNIKLWVARHAGNIVAGTVLYCTGIVVHTQYLAASADGKELGALDMLLAYLIDNECGEARYFDFGISTEHSGTILNNGLVLQKEGFGGRGVVYDAYSIPL
ncbi:MAG: GNAT family N-acetyltransferase [Bacteroidaceae bacterium]|nr:GNAT family N-acetyltransferase [Bacteroidaceae bacterium]